jgi:hypothetical protein
MPDPLVFGDAILPEWQQDYAAPACDDVNQNGIYDVLDFSAVITVE